MTTLPFDITIEKEEILSKLTLHDIIDWVDACDEEDEFQLLQYLITQIVPALSTQKMVRSALLMADSLKFIVDDISPNEVE
jgi:hypothetical protein